ncbi:MAG: hypothetical protein JRF63_04490 [Deltaproteobacteria bacterium]|nr:hypothetical protein [Deltaproteobacteria bacterium]
MKIVFHFVIVICVFAPSIGCEKCSRPGPGPLAEAEPVHVPFWEEHRQVVSGIDVHDAFRYFSGNVKNSMNHPALYADTKAGSLVVTGRGMRRVFENGNVDGAIAAYRQLLVDNGYVPKEEEDAGDPNRMVVVLLDDILPSESHALAVFSPEQNAVLRHVSNTTAFDYFSGNRGGAHDNPTIYAMGYEDRELYLVGRDAEETFKLAESDRAFDAFRALLTKRGFAIAKPDASPDGGKAPD